MNRITNYNFDKGYMVKCLVFSNIPSYQWSWCGLWCGFENLRGLFVFTSNFGRDFCYSSLNLKLFKQ